MTLPGTQTMDIMDTLHILLLLVVVLCLSSDLSVNNIILYWIISGMNIDLITLLLSMTEILDCRF